MKILKHWLVEGEEGGHEICTLCLVDFELDIIIIRYFEHDHSKSYFTKNRANTWCRLDLDLCF